MSTSPSTALPNTGNNILVPPMTHISPSSQISTAYRSPVRDLSPNRSRPNRKRKRNRSSSLPDDGGKQKRRRGQVGTRRRSCNALYKGSGSLAGKQCTYAVRQGEGNQTECSEPPNERRCVRSITYCESGQENTPEEDPVEGEQGEDAGPSREIGISGIKVDGDGDVVMIDEQDYFSIPVSSQQRNNVSMDKLVARLEALKLSNPTSDV